MNPLEFLKVEGGEAVQGSTAAPCEANANKAAVSPALVLVNQAFTARPLHESYDRVVALLQELRQFTDGGPVAAGVPRDAQKQDVLLGRQAMFASGPFAETKKAAKIVPEPGKAPHDEGIC